MREHLEFQKQHIGYYQEQKTIRPKKAAKKEQQVRPYITDLEGWFKFYKV